MNVEFVDEIPKATRLSSRSAPLRAFAAVLRENPGRWAKHPTVFDTSSAASSSAYYIRSGKSASFSPEEFQVEARACVVWLRYVGDAT